MITITQVEIIAFIAQTALTYIFVAIATGNASKQSTLDTKVDLRTTKEDIMAEIKSTREELLRESEMSTKATVEILKAEISKELEAVKQQKGNNDGSTRN